MHDSMPSRPSSAPAVAAAKYDVLGKSREELRDWLNRLGESAYRGNQIYHALYSERKFDFAEMSSLPAALRERMEVEAIIGMPVPARQYRSADGSIRYLLALPQSRDADAAAFAPRLEESNTKIEAVFMPFEGRQTVCISTQAGCAVDCHFCLTAQLGLIRNLSAGEIVGQALVALHENRDALAPQTNIVLMGQGEPLLNYDPVMAAVRILLDPNGMALAPRHVTLSTSGIVPGIERLAREKIRPKLAISLNASSDAQRDAIMPINRKYPLEVLLDACRNYLQGSSRERITFEYVLLGGFNDTLEDARRVVRLLSGLRAKVNLIPWNPGELPFRAPAQQNIDDFQAVLVQKGIPAFVRYSRGQDVSAACGQLALLETFTEANRATIPQTPESSASPA